MKKLFKRIFSKLSPRRPKYRIPNGIRRNKYKPEPLSLSDMERVHKAIQQKREMEANKKE